MLGNNIVELRAPEPYDADLMYQWENDTSLWGVSNTIAPFSRHILLKYIENSHQDIYQTKQLRLMIDFVENGNKETAGAIDLFDFDPYNMRAGVGIMVAEKFRRKKVASNAIEVLINYSFKTLYLNQLYCNITKENEASLKLFQTHNFVITGTKKEWVKTPNGWMDEYILQRINDTK